jgi:hypothetical protein
MVDRFGGEHGLVVVVVIIYMTLYLTITITITPCGGGHAINAFCWVGSIS